MRGIYLILNRVNGKCYVGQSVDIMQRWEQHKSKRNSLNYPLYRSLVKHGVENFNLIVLERDVKDLTQREQHWFDKVKPEYNLIAPRESSNLRRKAVYQLNKDTSEVIGSFNSLAEAARQTNSNHRHISEVCRGLLNQHNGYKWRYKEDLND